MEKLWSSIEDGKPTVSCLWVDCDYQTQDISQLKPHLFNTHFQPLIGSSFFGCEIPKCDFGTEDLQYFRRHLYFHVFHARLQHAAVSHLHQTKWATATCQTKGQGGQIFYCGEPIICHWDGCETEYDDVDEFFLHVTNHGKTRDNSDRNSKGFLTCLWQGCMQGFSTRASLKQHLRTHSGEKFASCPHCGIFFCSVTKFEDHIARKNPPVGTENVVSEESPSFKCKFCQKEFATERLLKSHCRHHVFHLKCPHCDMTTETPSHMRRHIQQRHSDQRPFQCDECSPPTLFKSMRELKVHHVSKHSDHYHECPECQVKYKWKHQLTGHLRKAHSNGEGDQATLYACHLCSNTYATGRTLGLHVIKIHNLQRPSGHTRFGFKRCADGFYRLKNERYESFDLAAELEEQKENDADGSSAASVAGTSTSAASPELPLHRDCQDSGAKVIAAYLQQEGIPVANVEIPGKLPIPRLPTTLPAVQFEPTRYDQTGFDDNGVLVYLDSFGLPAGPVTIVDSSLTYYSADPGYLQMPTGEMVALIPGQVYDNGGRIEVIESQEDSGSGQMA